jgi:hypothetical protein
MGSTEMTRFDIEMYRLEQPNRKTIVVLLQQLSPRNND